MKINLKFWSLAGSIILTGVLFYVFSQRLNFNEIYRTAQSTDKRLLLTGGLLLIISHYLRAARWKLLIMPISKQVKTLSCFWSFMSGTMVNFIIPHAGDLVRCRLVKKLDGISESKVLGTVLTERLIDTLNLLLLILIFIFSQSSQSYLHLQSFLLEHNYMSVNILIVISVLIFATLLLYQLRSRIPGLVDLLERTKNLLVNVKIGLRSIQNLTSPLAFLGLTLLIWTIYFLATYVILLAIPGQFNLSPPIVLAVLIMASLGWAGRTQGGIGFFHIMVAKTLVNFGFSSVLASSVAVVLHTTYSLFDLCFGLLAISIIQIGMIIPTRAHLNKAIT